MVLPAFIHLDTLGLTIKKFQFTRFTDKLTNINPDPAGSPAAAGPDDDRSRRYSVLTQVTVHSGGGDVEEERL